MSKYNFRLATLQKVRTARRDRERAALAEAFRAEQVLAEHQALLNAEQRELRDLQRSATAPGLFDVNRLLEAQRYELVLRARETQLIQQQAALAVETERRRHVLVEADRDVRVLELLDERKRHEHRRQQQRLDAKLLDEAAVLRHRTGEAPATW
jgi:flagellar FliJ protein